MERVQKGSLENQFDLPGSRSPPRGFQTRVLARTSKGRKAMPNENRKDPANTADQILGSRVLQLRLARNIDLTQLADALETDHLTYARMERGEVRISAEQIVSIAETLDIDVSTVFGAQPSDKNITALRRQMPERLSSLLDAYKRSNPL